jgi:hypothetical protein
MIPSQFLKSEGYNGSNFVDNFAGDYGRYRAAFERAAIER